jgi:hypothetical protein
MVATLTNEQIIAELQQRVTALYRLNAKLAAQVDRQSRVVDAARLWNSINHRDAEGIERSLSILSDACDGYDAAMARLAKESD